MKHLKSVVLLTYLGTLFSGFAQNEPSSNSKGYIEFNDRNNVVHGVYLGLIMGYGEIDQENAYVAGLKVAYVANQQFEVGFVGNVLYSEQNVFSRVNDRNEDLIGAYGGLHLEPIFFSKSRVNLSFPLLIGAGGVGYIDSDFDDDFEEEWSEDDVDAVFVAEPGISLLFNVSRYLQIEAGLKYRLSSKFDLPNSPVERLNGFSGGIGVKIGVFNMGRNRYKKNI